MQVFQGRKPAHISLTPRASSHPERKNDTEPMNWKRWLILVHRWLGVVMSPVFVLWFASGIVMMYVGYPQLSETERLDTLPAIDADRMKVSAGQALEAAGLSGSPEGLRLSTVAGRPVWHIRDAWGRRHTVFADDGAVLGPVTPALALASVRASGFMSPGLALRHEGRVDMDQWTISASLNAHRPLHRIALEDDAGTVLYVSDTSGEIVRDTHRDERAWNWVGSTIHWIYPQVLRQHGELWAQVIIWLSVIALLSIVSGLVIGIMRLRWRRRYRGDRVTPYRGIDKWHHISGLICVVFVLTFTFSGLMSMSPWGLFQSQGSAAQQLQAYQGADALELSRFPDLRPEALPRGVREVEWRMVGGQGYLLLTRALGEQWVMKKTDRVEGGLGLRVEDIRSLTAGMLPDAGIRAIDRLTRYDNYYYARRDQHRPLPVYRVRFTDAGNTWFDIDPESGQVMARHTDASRLNRWLFNGLHSLDFRFLLQRGILWDLTLIALSLAGLLFSMTSLILGWRRLRAQF